MNRFRILIAIALISVSLTLYCNPVFAQGMQAARIDKVGINGEFVEFSITSSEPFYVGGNSYYLKIGGFNFNRCQQLNIDRKGFIKFFIPLAEYNLLTEKTPIYLSFGELNAPNESKESLDKSCADNVERCKYLGLFSKKM